MKRFPLSLLAMLACGGVLAEEGAGATQRMLADLYRDGRVAEASWWLARERSDRWPEMAFARLLDRAQLNASVATADRDRRQRLAILRQLRQQSRPELIDGYASVLAEESVDKVVMAVIVDAFRADHRAAGGLARRLIERDRADAFPGSASPTVRRTALALLVSQLGSGDSDTVAALAWILEKDRAAVVRSALEQLRPGQRPELVAFALERLLPTGRVDAGGAAWPAVVAALERCDLESDHPLVERLVALAISDDRAAATALAGAVHRGTVKLDPTFADRLVRAVADSTDTARRHALLSILAVIDPAKAQAAAGFGDPWADLAGFRLED